MKRTARRLAIAISAAGSIGIAIFASPGTVQSAPIISASFGTAASGYGGALVSADVAGAVAATDWNNIPSGSLGPIALNSNAGPTLTTLTIGPVQGEDTGSQPATGGTVGDRKLMSKALYAGVTFSSEINVTLNNVSTSDPYDLYFYFNGADGLRLYGKVDLFTTAVSPTLIATKDWQDPYGPGFAGTYIESTGLGAGQGGNYIVFHGLTNTDLRMHVVGTLSTFQSGNTDVPAGDSPYAGISGIQIVTPAPVPEPGSAFALGIPLFALMVRRRKNRLTPVPVPV